MAMHPTRKHTLELKDSVSVIAPDCNLFGNSDYPWDVVDPHGIVYSPGGEFAWTKYRRPHPNLLALCANKTNYWTDFVVNFVFPREHGFYKIYAVVNTGQKNTGSTKNRRSRYDVAKPYVQIQKIKLGEIGLYK
ncbi:MAG: hypothetical protein JKY32_13940 [Rhizobiales bacterium]|nr:hypothetical protein [Hyphomicrobiales bacterium]